MNDALLALREKAQVHQDASKAKRFRDRGGLWQPLSPSKNRLMALLNPGNFLESNEDKSTSEGPVLSQKVAKAVKRKLTSKKNKGKGKISDIGVESSKPKMSRKAKPHPNEIGTKADVTSIERERDNMIAPSNGSAPTRSLKKQKQKGKVPEEQDFEDILSVQKPRGKQVKQMGDATCHSSTTIDVTNIALTPKAIQTQNSSKKRAIAEVTSNHDEESDYQPSPKKKQRKQPSAKVISTKTAEEAPKKLPRGRKIKAKPSVSSNNDTNENKPTVIDQRMALRRKNHKRQREVEATSDGETGSPGKRKRSNKITGSRGGDFDDYPISDDQEYVPQESIKPDTSKPSIKTGQTQENRLQKQRTVASSKNPVKVQLSTIMELDESGGRSSVIHRISSRPQSVPSNSHPSSQPVKPLGNTAELGKTKRKGKKFEEPLADVNYENVTQKTKPKIVQKEKKTSQPDSDSLPLPSNRRKHTNSQKEGEDLSVDGNPIRGNKTAKGKKGEASAHKTGISGVVKVGSTSPNPKPKASQAETGKNGRNTIQSTAQAEETSGKLKIGEFVESQYLTQRREVLDSDFDEIDFLS